MNTNHMVKLVFLSLCFLFAYSSNTHAAEFYIDGASEVTTSGVLVNGVYRSDSGTYKVSADIIDDEVEFTMTRSSGASFPGDEAQFAMFGNVTGSNRVSSYSGDLVGRSSGTVRIDAFDGYLFARLEIIFNGNTFVYYTTSSIRIGETVEVVSDITNVYSSPASVVAGSALTFYSQLNESLPSGWSLAVDFGAGYLTMVGSGTVYSYYAQEVNTVGNNRQITVRILDANGVVQGSSATGYYSVAEPVETQYAPRLSTVGTVGSEVEVGTNFCLSLRATDLNENLRDLQVNWGDGDLSDPYSYSSGSGDHTRQLCHAYSFGSYSWSATVNDHTDRTDIVFGSVNAFDVVPEITDIYSSPSTAVAGSAFTFNARIDESLPRGWGLSVDFGAGYLTMAGSGSVYSYYAQEVNTVGDSRQITVRILDANGVVQGSSATGSYSVTEPAETQYAPSLSAIGTVESEIEVGTNFCLSLRVTDLNENLRDLQVNWGDGELSAPYSYSSGSGDTTREFCHAYSSGSYSWSATVNDHTDRTDTISGSINVVDNSAEVLSKIADFLDTDSIIGSSNLFTPSNFESEMSRAEAVLIIDGFLKLLNPDFAVYFAPLADLTGFPDVDRWQDYAIAVTRLASYFGGDTTAVINTDNSYFYPLRAVSRAEFLGMLFQGLNYSTSESDYDLAGNFEDADFDQAPWAETYFASAVNLGLIVGVTEAGGKYLKPFDAVSVQEALYILAAVRRDSSIAQHDASGFSVQTDTNVYSKTAGSEFVPFVGFLSSVGITDLNVSQSRIEIDGMVCRKLTASSVVDTAAGGSAQYYWTTSAGYFYGENSTQASVVTLCPAGTAIADYVVHVTAQDGIGFRVEDEFNVSAQLLSEVNYQSVDESQIGFTGWADVAVLNDVVFGEPITLDLTSVGFSKANGVSLGHADVLVRIWDSNGNLVASENADGGFFSFDTSRLQNASLVYELELEATLNDQIRTMSVSERFEIEIIPAVRVFGQVQGTGIPGSPSIVVVRGIYVDIVDNYYSVLVPSVSDGDTFSIFVPESTDTNFFSENTVTVIDGISEYRQNMIGINTQPEPVPDSPVLLSPKDGLTVAANEPLTFIFNEMGNALSYGIRVYDSNSNSLYLNDEVSNANCGGDICELVVDGLNAQGEVFWSVRAYNYAGWGDWSDTAAFNVDQQATVPATPLAIYPTLGDSLVANETVVFRFGLVADATRYHVQRYDRTTGETSYSDGAIEPSVCSGASCEVSVPGIAVQDRAQWRVRAANTAGWSDWSSWIEFAVEEGEEVTVPATPLAIYPASGDSVMANEALVVRFGSVAGATRYHVQRYDRSTGETSYSENTIEPSVCSGESCEVSVPGIAAQERAQWRVRAANVSGWSDWSSWIEFAVEEEVTVPATPLAIYPASGDSVVANETVVFRFGSVAGATRYHVQRFDRATGETSYSDGAIEPSVCSGESCEVSVPGIAAQERAQWRVRAANVSGWSDWSSWMEFAVEEVAVPATPLAIYPASGDSVVANETVVFRFGSVADATRYHVQRYDRTVGETSYSENTIVPSVCSGESCEVSVPGIAAQERALWRVRAASASGWSDWSGWIEFAVEEDEEVTVPATPLAIYPASGDSVVANETVVFRFGSVADATRYHVQRYDRTVGETSYSENTIEPSVCSDEICEVSVPGIAAQEQAQWRVRAANVSGWSGWSSWIEFAVEEGEEVTVPATPLAIYPASGDSVVANETVVVQFGSVADATRYHVQRYDRTTGETSYSDGAIEPSVCSGESCEVSVPGIAAQERAQWRVRAANTSGWSDWSSWIEFAVEEEVTVPATPLAIYPASGDSVAANEVVVVQFGSVAGATRYHVQRYDRTVGETSYSENTIEPSVCSGASCEVSVPGIAAQERAQWRVRAASASGWSAWSGWIEFAVEEEVTVPATPLAIYPASGDSVVANEAVVFRFGTVSDATRYHVQRYDRLIGETSFSDSTIELSICNGASCQVSVPGTAAQDRAQWRVRAANAAGWSEWSEWVVFDVEEEIEEVTVPATPLAIYPSSGDTVVANEALLVRFSPASSATRYHVQRFDRSIGETSFSDSTIEARICGGASCQVSVPGTAAQDRAQWRVRAANAAGWSEWSEWVVFDVAGGVAAVSLIDTGIGGTCAYIDGLYCWGEPALQENIPGLTNPISLSVGRYFACAIDDYGLVCWGSGFNGELEVPEIGDPLSVGAGYWHACAASNAGVECWGSPSATQNTPFIDSPLTVESGSGYSCALTADSQVQCWGSSNIHGKLDVPILQNPSQLVVGYGHACVVDEIGVTCWGDNEYNQLNAPLLVDPTSVAAGQRHSCAIDQGAVTCWGDNSYGQLEVPDMSNPVAVSAGWLHSCALDDNGVSCWGAGLSGLGQLSVPAEIRSVQ